MKTKSELLAQKQWNVHINTYPRASGFKFNWNNIFNINTLTM